MPWRRSQTRKHCQWSNASALLKRRKAYSLQGGSIQILSSTTDLSYVKGAFLSFEGAPAACTFDSQQAADNAERAVGSQREI